MTDSVLRENVMIITGASSGIGRALALQLAELGAWLALAARDVNQLAKAAEECRRYSGRALVVPTDVAEQAQCQNLVEQTVAEYGRLDTLINNAGISMLAKFEELKDLAVLERIMRVNYLAWELPLPPHKTAATSPRARRALLTTSSATNATTASLRSRIRRTSKVQRTRL